MGELQAAFLIDADYFADPVALNSAWLQLKSHVGRVAVCRAYGGASRLHTLAPVWCSLGARTFPNLALEKNTTDAALIADAVALHFQYGVRLFAIASGDADFAPLVVRLREWGCEVWCFAIESTLFAGAKAYYDRVVRFAPSPTANGEPPAQKPPQLPVVATTATAGVSTVVVPVPCSVPSAAAKSTKPELPKQMPVVQQSPKPTPSPPRKVAAQVSALPEEVERILKVVPNLRQAPQQLNQVVPVLRQKSILAGTTKSTKFFAKYPAYFQLTPAKQPTHVAYLSAPAPPKEVLPVKQPAIATPVPSILSWPETVPRRPAPPLLDELHGLRSVLIQLALRRVTVADVLIAVPELARRQACSYIAVSGRLRQRGLLRPDTSALRILERYPSSFAVSTPTNPQAVRYLG